MQRIKKNDQVRVIKGKDKGAEGRVVRVWPVEGKVLVEGVNVQTKHRRMQRSRSGGTEGGIMHEEAPIDASNVMLLDGKTPTRVGFEPDKDGKKRRIARKSGEEL